MAFATLVGHHRHRDPILGVHQRHNEPEVIPDGLAIDGQGAREFPGVGRHLKGKHPREFVHRIDWILRAPNPWLYNMWQRGCPDR